MLFKAFDETNEGKVLLIVDIWPEFVIPFANAVDAVAFAVVASESAEFAVVVVVPNVVFKIDLITSLF